MLHGNHRIAFTIAPLLFGAAAVAQTPEPGEKWEITTSMETMGMKMPGGTTESCTPKSSTDLPVAADGNCVIVDRKHSGNTEEIRMHCTGKSAAETTDSTIHAERLGPDHFRSKIESTSSQGTMTMLSEGRKVPGACDAGEAGRKAQAAGAKAQKQVADGEAQAREQMGAATSGIAKMCQESAAKGIPDSFVADGSTPLCRDPKDVKVLCNAVQGYEGFENLSKRERAAISVRDRLGGNRPTQLPLTQGAKVCGVDVEHVRAHLCNDAEEKNQFAFLSAECPVIAAGIAKRECAGRKFTSEVSIKYRGFCGEQMANAARSAPATEAAAEPSAKPGAKSAVEPAVEPGVDPASAAKPVSAVEDTKAKVQKAKDKLKDLLHF